MTQTSTPAEVSETDRVLIDELLMLEGAMERNYAWVCELIRPHLGASLLEVGSGVGVISRHLVARGDPVVLSDHHPAYLAHLRERFGQLPHVRIQILDLDDEQYRVEGPPIDTVVCLNVLEHLEDDAAVLGRFARLLPPGGRLVLQVPNGPRLFGSLDEAYGHYRRYTPDGLRRRLEDAGFRIRELRYFNPLAVPGWILSGKLLRSRRLNVPSVKLFNALVPLVRRLDFLSALGGLALIACAEKAP
jgi:2-polyprenyl-3-methyl-5-hydroxy-6-metoxy-1,4-benzoquinol methylase